MEDDKRCTKFPQSSDLASGFLESPLLQSSPPSTASRLQKRTKPPRLPVAVKRPADSIDEVSKRRSNFSHECSPWSKYQKLQQECTKGRTCLAYEKASPSTIVAIKEYSDGVDGTTTNYLLKTSHTNLVNLLCVFVSAGSLYSVYERMDVNLDQLLSAVKLKEPQIAFLCKETLQGLAYIHEELHVHHGDIKPANIFLTLSGQVKIGNIALSLLRQVHDNKVQDVKSIGRMIKEIIEPGDFKKNPSSMVLKNVDYGGDSIRTFMAATQSSNLRNLLNVRSPVFALYF
ncbi:mitogen activated protein kinase kinase, putative [Talaromyces stipitatus ATCC 10500]|uniref:Mitogen activated protein kinase kinase, putative n=1 Tax=Talaromyces stipitatus (strain ATCC 10500 / CBS 375.48 / QM 6759 / NRRL 1006) TaxID=441959 RepID=B8M0B0_TALSN|nr:mitogen activated protein kinase kinase, putative [Talaromyces stipitatus ATCC 10500]EED21207.1 mitogen activated protein kinase kinase, putative [Talaromyces stipitatus ATCC 10500]